MYILKTLETFQGVNVLKLQFGTLKLRLDASTPASIYLRKQLEKNSSHYTVMFFTQTRAL